jgi:TPR repeat protein
MLLATVVLSAALAPQTPPAESPEAPLPEAPATQEMAPPSMPEEPSPALAVEPVPAPPAETAPAMAAEPAPAAESAIQEHIDAGLKVFIRGRFSQARAEFEKAYEADPQNPAAAFYLGYACYKIGEPSRRMDADKQRAKELFAKAYSLDPAFMPVWKVRKE